MFRGKRRASQTPKLRCNIDHEIKLTVRGKHKFDTPFRVTQSGRSVEGGSDVVEPTDELLASLAMSFGGQVRFIPALIERVGCPHPAQKGFRAFQSRRARA